MTVRKGIPRQGKHRNEPLRDKMSRSPGSVPTPEHAAEMGQEAFSGRTAKEKWREHMRENPYKRLPPIERKQDGSLYRMTPAQRKQANALIRRECCCYEDGNCMLLDDGDTHTCPQTVSFSVCCKWFRWSVLPQIGTLEAEIFRDKELKRCAVCGWQRQSWRRRSVSQGRRICSAAWCGSWSRMLCLAGKVPKLPCNGCFL